tara:strand:+ start:27201 stop:29615 length:2415 start_codon:yes stop_codon:yes gene_type:complete
MNVLWRKLWHDLWERKSRTLLVIMSVAAGVFCVGAIFGMNDQLYTQMDISHASTYPSHINMFTFQHLDQDMADQLSKIDGVLSVDITNQIGLRYKLTSEDKWQPGMVATRPDYNEQTYDQISLIEGEWPTKNTLGIERTASEYYGINIGDEVQIELADGTARWLPINGMIRHPFVEPPSFGGDALFFMNPQGLERLGIPEGAYFNLKVRVSPFSRMNSEEMAFEIKDQLSKEQISVGATFYQKPDEHWGKMFLDGVVLVMEILAVASLFMSVVLVTNTMTAIVTEQTNQIGIIKAIGGQRRTIIQLYLGGVLVYGILALAISLPLGAAIAFGGSQWFLNIFNIDHEIFRISQSAAVYQLLAALAVPVLAALWPVIHGAAITVREAIASYGLGSGQYGGDWVDKWIERVGQQYLTPPQTLAIGNMFRRKGRLILTQLVLVAAGTMFIMVMSLSKSLITTVSKDMDRRGYNLRLIFVWDQRSSRVIDLANSVPGVARASMWYSHAASVLRSGQVARDVGSASNLVGIPVAEEMYRPTMLSGRWLQPKDGNVVVISKELATDNNIDVGDIITLDLDVLGSDEWQVVGIFQVVFRKVGEPDPLYAPLSAVYRSTKKFQYGTDLLIRTTSTDPQSAIDVKEELQDLYEDRRMRVSVFGTSTTEEEKEYALFQFSTVTQMLLMLATLVAIVGGLGLMGSLSISVVERTREIGVMRAIGARSNTIINMFLLEGLAQGIVSWILSVPIAFVIAQPISRQLGQVMLKMDLDFYYNWIAALIWLGAVIVLAILASLWPARTATKISVRQSLSYA